ncbi:hypothetical protein [Glutamicibacter protophormiae]|uniref:hypothetical protein n=1 Tax=Glutamicibacter protophormiae TaxID=37930 RepID=UPI00195EF816|nr:hypothetical protein [Glutamicibacter protophormiae]QRQ77891.1 hypothetical protein JQN66_13330 [Glutamicibacter protophormiae]
MESQYLNVDFGTPLIGVAVAGALLIATVPLLLHGWYRRKKFEQLPEGYQTYKLRSSIRTEVIAGGLGALLVVVLGIASAAGFASSARNLEANIERQYNPAQLSLGTFNGSWMSVGITLDDGTRFNDVPVEIRDGNEPFIEDVWYHYHPKPAG